MPSQRRPRPVASVSSLSSVSDPGASTSSISLLSTSSSSSAFLDDSVASYVNVEELALPPRMDDGVSPEPGTREPSAAVSDLVVRPKTPRPPMDSREKYSSSMETVVNPSPPTTTTTLGEFEFRYSWADRFESSSLLAAIVEEGKNGNSSEGGEGCDGKKPNEEYEFLCLSDYGFRTPPDLFSEEELDIVSLDSEESEKLIFELDSEEERSLYSSDDDDELEKDEKKRKEEEEGVDEQEELPRYATTRVIYYDAAVGAGAANSSIMMTSAIKNEGVKPRERKVKSVSFADDQPPCGQVAVKNDEEATVVEDPIPTVDAPFKVPTPDQLRRLRERLRVMMPKMTEKTAASLSMKGVEERLRIVGVNDPNSVSVCVKKAMLKGFLHIEGPQSLLQLLCYQKCLGKNCQKAVRVRLLDILHQGDFGGEDPKYVGLASRRVVFCDSPQCFSAMYVTNMCTGEPRIVGADLHHHCRLCPQWGACLDDTELRHCHKCGDHFYADVDEIVDLERFPKMACEGCQLSDGRVCEFINGLLDDAPPIEPFELRLFGPGQLNPCVLAAIKSQLVAFPRLPERAASKVKSKIEKRGGIMILNKNMNADDFKRPISVAKQLLKCTAFTGKCYVCSEPLSVNWAEAIYLDHDELRPNDDGTVFPVICPKKNCKRKNYLTEACRGTPKFQSYDHSDCHCSYCTKFGWCRPLLLSHCPRCGRHADGGKGERLCGECIAQMGEAATSREIQLPELERCMIVKAAKSRNANALLVEDKDMALELEKSCDVQ